MFCLSKINFLLLPPNFWEEHTVDYLKQFVIPFRGLGVGNHSFEFRIDEKFFEAIEYSELKNGNVNLKLELTKEERMLVFEFHFEGTVEVTCDRCLDDFDFPVNGNEQLIVKFGEDWEEESDAIVIIPESEHQFDLSQYIYEYINLLLPMQRIHPDNDKGKSTCNAEMLARLGSTSEKKEDHDPRWDVLLKLKDENKN